MYVFPNPASDYFNVGLGKPITVLEVAKALEKNYNTTVNIEISGQFRIGDIRHNFADLTKVKAKLGFEPSVSFDEGIMRFVNWVKGQEIGEDNYENSLKEMKEKGLFK